MEYSNTSLEPYRADLPYSLEKRSLCFLLNKQEILLGYKKEGFGEGKWLGIGGKQEDGETINETAIRETEEEIGVTPTQIEKIGILRFYFPYVNRPEKWNQEVTVFFTKTWRGDIGESDEIAPKWFPVDAIPFEKMWSDAAFWLPFVIAGDQFSADFLFNKDLGVQEHEIRLANEPTL